MEFVLTEEFSQIYDQLSDVEAIELDETIQRLLDAPGSPWARQGRIGSGVGDAQYDGAWIVAASVGGSVYNLYWEYANEETLLFIALAPTS